MKQMKPLHRANETNEPKSSQKAQNSSSGTKKRKRTSLESLDRNNDDVSDLEKSQSDGGKVSQKNKRPRFKPETVGAENRENEPPKVEQPVSSAKSSQAAEGSRPKGQISKNQSTDSKIKNEKSKGKSSGSRKRSHFQRKPTENQTDKNSRVVKDFRIEADDKTEVAYTVKSSMLRKKKHWFEPKSLPSLPILPEIEICKKFKISPFALPVSEIGYRHYIRPDLFDQKEITSFSVLDSSHGREDGKDASCRRNGRNLRVVEKSIAEDSAFAELYQKFSHLDYDLI